MTSLAARVHSPVQSDETQHILGLDLILLKPDGRKGSQEAKRPDWQLPSLKFQPLSVVDHAQSNTERRKSAEGVRTISTPEIISPTPGRPVSSQSRRRFNKILGIEEDHSTIISAIPWSYNSLNFAKLKRVLELQKSTYPARLSIPPYSPRRSIIEEGTAEHDVDDGGRHDAASSQTMSNARSSIESLLDKHIQCLGLKPESFNGDLGAEDNHENEAEPLAASETEITVQFSGRERQHFHEQSRPKTASSAFQSKFASPERVPRVPKKLLSKNLYSTVLPGRSRPTTSQSLPCTADTASSDRAAIRPSIRGQALASTGQLLSSPPTCPGFEATFGKKLQEQYPNVRRYKVRRRSGVTLSPIVSAHQLQEPNDIGNCDDVRTLQKTWRNNYLAGEASERRIRRVRLKLKRSSISQGQLGDRETSSSSLATFHTASGNINGEEEAAKAPSRDMRQSVELPPCGPGTHTLAIIDQPSGCGLATLQGQKTTASPDIPQRSSSRVAIVADITRPSMAISRLASIRTVRSHRSKTSLAEPMNSTRFSAQIPRFINQTASLAAPDLAPSLSSLNLDLSVRYPDVMAGPRPVLRGTRSFFSDDSSAMHRVTGSLRNRFHLHNFRSAFPSSPRARRISDGADVTLRSSASQPHQSRQLRGHSGEEEERDLYGTVGMTDFAYRKRQVVEKLKDWWKRHSVQMKLGMKKKKSHKNIAKREGCHVAGL